MKNKKVLLIIIAILISNIIPNVSSLEISASKTYYVDDDGGKGRFRKIQDAIDYADDGDTIFVYSGLYSEFIIIDKSIKLIGEDRESTIIEGYTKSYSDIILRVRTGNVSINGFTIQNRYKYKNIAIRLETNDNIIYDNIIENCRVGFNIFSDNNEIFDNIIQKNEFGIGLDKKNNHIHDNIIKQNKFYGIYQYGGSCYNTIENNTISDNDIGYILRGIYGITNYNIICGNKIYDNDAGIYLSHSSRNIISNNILTNNTNGLRLEENSCSNIIKENLLKNNTGAGIRIIDGGNNNTISNNFIFENNNGINIQYCGSYFDITNIYSNEIKGNNIGIQIISSKNTHIYKNRISNNSNGIYFQSSSNKKQNSLKNSVFSNDFIQNENGIYLKLDSDNKITNNNFISNINSSYYEFCDNYWFNNYWDRPRLLPYKILGTNIFYKFEFDWIPAKKPHDIGG